MLPLRHIHLLENSRTIVIVSTDGCYLCSLCPIQEPWNRENTLFPSSFSYQVGAWSGGMNACHGTFFPPSVCLCFVLTFHRLMDMSWHVDIYPNFHYAWAAVRMRLLSHRSLWLVSAVRNLFTVCVCTCPTDLYTGSIFNVTILDYTAL